VSWWRRLGRRNLIYVAFVVLLIPFGVAMEAAGFDTPEGS
jgi:hypothetical protein